MSRSYKKNPITKEESGGMKNTANRKVRRRLKSARFGLANGRAYRKVFCSWCISDWRLRKTYKEYLADAEDIKKAYLSRMRQYSFWDWYKMYKRK
ncbi:MAG: hypothetical protein FWD01_04450 [Defluviitaleaceae bacterium]|nr:hypothetical protein [Defluviitaleaceae bacterium]